MAQTTRDASFGLVTTHPLVFLPDTVHPHVCSLLFRIYGGSGGGDVAMMGRESGDVLVSLVTWSCDHVICVLFVISCQLYVPL
jgi:hypothetical protein